MNISGIVGLDLSITGSGVCRYDCKSGNTEYETIGTKPKDGSMMERNLFSAYHIIHIIEDNDVVFIENYAFGVNKNASRLVTLAEFGGIVKLLIYRKTKKEPILVASGTIKKWLSGNGHLPQDDFKIAAYKKYHIEFATGDEVIAYSMVDFGRYLLGLDDRKLYKYEEEVLKNFKVKHPEILHMFAN